MRSPVLGNGGRGEGALLQCLLERGEWCYDLSARPYQQACRGLVNQYTLEPARSFLTSQRADSLARESRAVQLAAEQSDIGAGLRVAMCDLHQLSLSTQELFDTLCKGQTIPVLPQMLAIGEPGITSSLTGWFKGARAGWLGGRFCELAHPARCRRPVNDNVNTEQAANGPLVQHLPAPGEPLMRAPSLSFQYCERSSIPP